MIADADFDVRLAGPLLTWSVLCLAPALRVGARLARRRSTNVMGAGVTCRHSTSDASGSEERPLATVWFCVHIWRLGAIDPTMRPDPG